MAKSKLVKANEKIADAVVGGYRKIEEGVVGGYKKIENGAVNGFTKKTDSFVDQFLTKDGETVEEARNNRRYIICTWHVHGTDPGVERISAGSCHGCDRHSCASEHGICLTMVWSNMILGIVIGIVGIVVLLCLIPLTKGLK